MDPNNPYQGPHAELLDTPRPEEAAVGTARRRPMAHGWLWWKRAWSLVAANWVLWCLAMLVFFAVIFGISLLSQFVPLVGTFVPTLFSPVLAAGLFHLAWRRWGDDEFEFGGLFAGFSNRTGPLFVAGLIQLVLQVVFTALLAVLALLVFEVDVATVFGVAFDNVMPMSSAAPAGVDTRAKVSFGLLAAALFAPYLAMLWFQAPLVYFGQRNGFKALGESLVAVLRNWAPMLWLSVVALLVLASWAVVFAAFVMFANTLLSGVSGILAMTLLGLLALTSGLFLIAVMTVSMYASFRDIFGADDEPEATPELCNTDRRSGPCGSGPRPRKASNARRQDSREV